MKHGCLPEPDYLSIDVDSIDLWLAQALLKNGLRPRLMSIEYNCNFPEDVSATVLPGTMWESGDAVYGASLLALCKMAARFDYYPIAVVPTLDLFFFRHDVVQLADLRDSQMFGDDEFPFEIDGRFTALKAHAKPTPERLKHFVTYPDMQPLTPEIIQRCGWA